MKAETCSNCKLWSGDTAPSDMPGVRAGHRVCQRPRVDKSIKEYRAPTDWCSKWTEREEKK